VNDLLATVARVDKRTLATRARIKDLLKDRSGRELLDQLTAAHISGAGQPEMVLDEPSSQPVVVKIDSPPLATEPVELLPPQPTVNVCDFDFDVRPSRSLFGP
jgi:hypothetical protein